MLSKMNISKKFFSFLGSHRDYCYHKSKICSEIYFGDFSTRSSLLHKSLWAYLDLTIGMVQHIL